MIKYSFIPVVTKKRFRLAACMNGVLWGIGNSLIGSMLLIFLIMDLAGAKNFQQIGLPIAWILALPRLLGILRVLSPWLIDKLGSRKWFCIGLYLAAPIFVMLIPFLIPVLIQWDHFSRAVLIIVLLWCIYHLLEYMATTAFWSWFGDIVPQKIRGRFLAIRERWTLFGQILGVILVTQYMFFLDDSQLPQWQRYLVPAMTGSAFLFISAFPLIKVAEIPWKTNAISFNLTNRLKQILAPLSNRRFMLFCFFGCWIHLANGLSQSPQNIIHREVFPRFVFGVLPQFVFVLLLTNTCRLGQIGLSARVGKRIDRFGSCPVMMLCMAVVSTGSFFYFLATPQQPWWIIGAWGVWVFWVGVNIGIANLSISFAPQEERTSYLAFYFAVTTAMLALSTLGGGILYDRFIGYEIAIPMLGQSWNWSKLSFLLSGLLRFASILILWRLMRWTRKTQNDYCGGEKQ